MKILILVLACENEPFISIQKHGIEKTWGKDYSNIIFYYYNQYIKNTYLLESKYLYMPGLDSILNCNKKNY